MMLYDIRNIKNISPLEFEQWWHDLVRDGTAAAVFPGWPPCGRGLNFWRWFAEDDSIEINMIYGEEGKRLAFFWLAGRQALAAFLNFGFLREGLKVKDELGRYILDTLWRTGYRSLASITPEYNLPAIRYAESLGGRAVCRWPGACVRVNDDKRHTFHDGVMIQFTQAAERAAEIPQER